MHEGSAVGGKWSTLRETLKDKEQRVCMYRYIYIYVSGTGGVCGVVMAGGKKVKRTGSQKTVGGKEGSVRPRAFALSSTVTA